MTDAFFQDWLLSAPSDKPLLNVWLGSKAEQAEESVKPSLMKIAESFEKSSEVEDSFLEAAIKEEVQDRLIAMLRKKALAMDTMDRAQLLAFVKTFCQFCFPPLYR